MNKRGGALTTVLVFTGLLLLLALPALQLAGASYKESVNGQIKTQAFYLAEAGREHGREVALSTLQELANQPGWDPMSLAGTIPYIAVAPNHPLPNGTYEAKAWLAHLEGTEYEILVKTTGIAHDTAHLAQVLTERIPVSIQPGQAGETALDTVLFSNGRLEIISGTVEGDLVTNTTAHNSVIIGDSGTIKGDLLIGPGADPEKVIKMPDWRRGRNDVVTGTTGVSTDTRAYPQVTMPPLPTDLPPRAAFYAGWDPSPPYRINEDGYYPEIVVLSELRVNVGSGERRLRVGKLALRDSSKLILEGSGKLILFVEDEFVITGSSTLNASSHHERAFVYYYGKPSISLKGNVRMHGSVQAQQANVEIDGSGKLTGHIITNGTKVDVLGHGAAVVSLLYAPNADVSIGGSGSIEGAIVSKSCTVQGAGRIRFNMSVNEVYREIVGESGSTVIVGPGVWSPR